MDREERERYIGMVRRVTMQGLAQHMRDRGIDPNRPPAPRQAEGLADDLQAHIEARAREARAREAAGPPDPVGFVEHCLICGTVMVETSATLPVDMTCGQCGQAQVLVPAGALVPGMTLVLIDRG